MPPSAVRGSLNYYINYFLCPLPSLDIWREGWLRRRGGRWRRHRQAGQRHRSGPGVRGWPGRRVLLTRSGWAGRTWRHLGESKRHAARASHRLVQDVIIEERLRAVSPTAHSRRFIEIYHASTFRSIMHQRVKHRVWPGRHRQGVIECRHMSRASQKALCRVGSTRGQGRSPASLPSSPPSTKSSVPGEGGWGAAP